MSKVNVFTGPKEPEPVVKELVVYSEKLKKNPKAKPPKVLVGAYERAKPQADAVFDSLVDMKKVFTGDPKDNARVFFLVGMRLSQIATQLVQMFVGNPECFPDVIEAMNALDKFVRDSEKK